MNREQVESHFGEPLADLLDRAVVVSEPGRPETGGTLVGFTPMFSYDGELNAVVRPSFEDPIVSVYHPSCVRLKP